MSVRCDYPNTPVKNLQLPTTCDVTGYIEMLPEPQDAAGWCPSLRQHPAASQCIRQHPAATGNCPNLNNVFLINGQYPNDSGSIRCFRQVTGKKYIFADETLRTPLTMMTLSQKIKTNKPMKTTCSCWWKTPMPRTSFCLTWHFTHSTTSHVLKMLASVFCCA